MHYISIADDRMITWISSNWGLIAATALLLTSCGAVLADRVLWKQAVEQSLNQVWNKAFEFKLIAVAEGAPNKASALLSPVAIKKFLAATSSGTRSTVRRKRAMLDYLKSHQSRPVVGELTEGVRIGGFKYHSLVLNEGYIFPQGFYGSHAEKFRPVFVDVDLDNGSKASTDYFGTIFVGDTPSSKGYKG